MSSYCKIQPFELLKDFQSSFRFIEKLKSAEIFHVLLAPTCIAYPILSIPYQNGTFVIPDDKPR